MIYVPGIAAGRVGKGRGWEGDTSNGSSMLLALSDPSAFLTLAQANVNQSISRMGPTCCRDGPGPRVLGVVSKLAAGRRRYPSWSSRRGFQLLLLRSVLLRPWAASGLVKDRTTCMSWASRFVIRQRRWWSGVGKQPGGGTQEADTQRKQSAMSPKTWEGRRRQSSGIESAGRYRLSALTAASRN